MSYVSAAFNYLKGVFVWQAEMAAVYPSMSVAIIWTLVICVVVF